jgi:hypothetical protein
MQLRESDELGTKLTTWANEPSMLDLKADFDASKPMHDLQVGKINGWNDLLKVSGKAKPETRKGRSAVQPKLIRRQAEWRYSALSEPFLGSSKLYEVKPATFEDGPAAQQNELVLNHQFRTQFNRVKFIDDLVRCTVDEGTSVIKLGWKRLTKMVEEEVPVFTHYNVTTEEEMTALQEAIQAKEADFRSYDASVTPEIRAAVDYYEETNTPTTAKITGQEKIKVEKVLENRPTAQVLNPANVYIDPSCEGDLDKAMFAIVSFETSKSDLKKDTARYKNLDDIDWDNLGTIVDTDHATKTPVDFQLHDKARKKVIAYEYWGFYDIDNSGILTPIVATWIGGVLIRMEKNPFPDEKIPLVLIPYLPIKRELFGEPDAELLEDNQKILGAVTRGMIDLLGRSANAQQGFAKGMLDPLNRRKYDNGQDYEYNPNTNPNIGLVEHKYPEIPQSALTMLTLMNNEAEALTGVKSFSGGVSGDAYGDVAAGIRGVLDAASKREMAILRRISSGVTQMGNKIIAMNAVFLSEEEVIRKTNEEFVTVKREDLKGNFDLVVDISTAEIDDAQAKDLGFLLQTIGNNMDPEMRGMILSEIARLKRMPELAKKIENYQPQPDPVQEKLKELSIKKIELEISQIESEIALNQAKAAKATAEAQATAQETGDQASGVSHARELEQSRAQSEGNQNLVVTKALATPRKEGEGTPDIEAAVGFNQLSKAQQQEQMTPALDSTLERDALAEQDPRFSIGSRFFEPALDPASNPNLSI